MTCTACLTRRRRPTRGGEGRQTQGSAESAMESSHPLNGDLAVSHLIWRGAGDPGAALDMDGGTGHLLEVGNGGAGAPSGRTGGAATWASPRSRPTSPPGTCDGSGTRSQGRPAPALQVISRVRQARRRLAADPKTATSNERP
jgi:hypothetical protein